MCVPIVAFGIFVAPLIIDPMFNKFTPLPSGPLRVRIERLATQAGIPHAPIYVVDKSRQTRTTNAYVTGLGASARIVIWDTTLQQLPPDEVVGIVGHEMGHYVLKHIPWGFAETVAGLLVLLPLTGRIVGWALAKRGNQWRLRGMTDLAAVPVFLLTVSVLGFLADPITNGLSRRMEHQADAYGLAATRNGPALARAFVYFASHDLSDPYPPPLVKFWLFSHPPIGERINFVLGRKSAPPYGT
jgi:STE24 endopeptidase